jgi:hypothetical protein
MCKFHSGGSAYFSDGFSHRSSVLVDIYALCNPLQNFAPERYVWNWDIQHRPNILQEKICGTIYD